MAGNHMIEFSYSAMYLGSIGSTISRWSKILHCQYDIYSIMYSIQTCILRLVPTNRYSKVLYLKAIIFMAMPIKLLVLALSIFTMEVPNIVSRSTGWRYKSPTRSRDMD